jgi:hypothetical protein
MSCPDDSEIFKICFPDSLHGFAVGRSGAFLVYSKPVIPSAETGVSSGLSSWQLQQNSPNPVSRTTVFRFRIPENHNKNKGITADNEQSFRIGIHDSFGRLVYLSGPTDGEPGWHEMSADLSALENGVYWYRLYCSGKPVMGAGVRRMMVAR